MVEASVTVTVSPLSAGLSWDENPVGENIFGYKLYYGTSSRGCDKNPEDEQFVYSGPQADEGASPIVLFVEDLEDSSNPSFDLTNLSSDLGVNYVFAVTAFNIVGESPYAFEVGFEDVAPPVICDASAATETQVILDFTEFVEVASATATTNYRLADESDQEIRISSVTYDNVTFKNVTLNTDPLIEGEKYALTANNIKDFFSGNVMTEVTLEFVYTKAPHVKKLFVLNGSDGVRVTYSEKTTLDASGLSSNYVLDNALSILSATPGDEVKNVDVLTDMAFVEGSDYNITLSNITDLFANMLPANSLFSFSHALDQVTPLVLSAHVTNPSKNDAKVYVVFSEEMDKASAETTGNYVINNGIVVDSAALQGDGRTVILTTSSHLDGDYDISVSNITDDSLKANAMETRVLRYKVVGSSGIQSIRSRSVFENRKKMNRDLSIPAMPSQLRMRYK